MTEEGQRLAELGRAGASPRAAQRDLIGAAVQRIAADRTSGRSDDRLQLSLATVPPLAQYGDDLRDDLAGFLDVDIVA
jgi:hypothetical protein